MHVEFSAKGIRLISQSKDVVTIYYVDGAKIFLQFGTIRAAADFTKYWMIDPKVYAMHASCLDFTYTPAGGGVE